MAGKKKASIGNRATVSRKPPREVLDALQPIPMDTGDFEEIRSKGLLYVDKTDYLHRLVNRVDSQRFFLARPRRFEKSLMITTLKAIFEGRRDLFKGLKIDKMKYDWKKYPVIHLDMSDCASELYEDFEAMFPDVVEIALKNAGYTYNEKKAVRGNAARIMAA